MSWHDLLDPTRMVGRAFRWCAAVLALMLAASLAVRYIEHIPFLGMILGASLVAAAVLSLQNRQAPSRNRTRAIGRAERTPVMPIAEEDQ